MLSAQLLLPAVREPLSAFSVQQAHAATGINKIINYQGKVSAINGAAVADGEYNMRFKIFDAPTGGNILWSENWTDSTTRVTMTGGLFTVGLGTHVTMTGSVNFNTDNLYLQVEFDPGNDGSFEETFSPRRRFGAVPYAFNTDTIDGLDSTEFLRKNQANTMTGTILFSTGGTAIRVRGAISGAVLHVTGALTSSGTLAVDGDVSFRNYTSCALIATDAAGNLSCESSAGTSTGEVLAIGDPRYVNTSGDTMTGALVINVTGGNRNTIGLNVLNTLSGAVIHAEKTLTSSGGLVWEGAASGASLYVASSLQGAGLTDCDVAETSKLLWDSSTGRFSCGTDQSGGGGSSGIVDHYVLASGDTMTGALVINVTGGDQNTIGLNVLNTISGAVLHAEKLLTSSGSLVMEGNFYMQTRTDAAGAFQILDADGGEPVFYVDTDSERVAIGGDNPGAALDVLGNVHVRAGSISLSTSSAIGSNHTAILSGNSFGMGNNGTRFTFSYGVSTGNGTIDVAFPGGDLLLDASGDVRFINGGNVGINAGDNPTTMLEVGGTISGASLYITSSMSGAGLTDCDVAETSKLLWDATTQRFSCGTDQSGGGGGGFSTGNVLTVSDPRYVNASGDTMTGALTINVTGGNQSTIGLNVLNTISGAVLHAEKTLTSSGGLVWEGAASGASLYVASSLQGAGLTDCDVAETSKLLWDSSTGRFSCGTDQSGGGGELVDHYVLASGDTMTGALVINVTGGNRNTIGLNVLNTISGAVLHAEKTLTSSGGLVWEGAASGATLYVASSLQGAGLTDCDVAETSKLLWDSSTGRFSCGTDQSGGGGELVDHYVLASGDTMTGALVINVTGGNQSTIGLNVLNTVSGAVLHGEKALTSSGRLIVSSTSSLPLATLIKTGTGSDAYMQYIQRDGIVSSGTVLDASGGISDTQTSDNSNGSQFGWSNMDNIEASDDAYAVASTMVAGDTSQYLIATDFGFNIPLDATILGIEVNVERKGLDSSRIYVDSGAYIVKGGTLGSENKASVEQWTTTDEIATYGGSVDDWEEDWGPGDINANDFGFALSVETDCTLFCGDARPAIDYITITVYYSYFDLSISDGTWATGIDVSDNAKFKILPQLTLEAGHNGIILTQTGSLGLGTTSPEARLAVSGSVVIGNDVSHRQPKAMLEVQGSISGSLLTLSNMRNCTLHTSTTGAVICSTNAYSTGSVLNISDPRYVNASGDTMTGALTINVTGGNQSTIGLNVLNTISGAVLHAEKTLTSSGGLVWEGAASGASLYVASSLQGAGLTDCDVAETSKLLWDSSTGRFSCGTDQSGGGGELVDHYVLASGDTMTGALVINVTGGNQSTIGLNVLNTVSGAVLHGEKALTSSGILAVEGGSFFGSGIVISKAANTESIRLTDTNSSNSISIRTGTGDPNSVVSAQLGSLFFASDTGRLWKNNNGDTQWVEVRTGSGTVHMAKMTRKDAVQTIPANTNTVIDFDTEEYDVGGIASVSTNTFTIAKTGKYLVSAAWRVASAGTTTRTQILRNDVIVHEGHVTAPQGITLTSGAQDTFDLVAGDEIQMSVFISSETDTTTAVESRPRMSVIQLDGIAGGSTTPWTDGGSLTYLTDTTDNVGIGAATAESKLEVIGSISGATLYITSAMSGAGLTDCDLSTQKLQWDSTTERFSCGTIGASTNTGNVLAIGDPRYVNTSGDSMTGALTINVTDGNQSTIGLNVLNTISGAVIRAEKALASSGTLVWEGAASGASLYVASSLQGAGLTDCDAVETSKLLWDSSTGRFSCGTDQSGGGGSSGIVDHYVLASGDTMTGALVINVAGGTSSTQALRVLQMMSGASLSVAGGSVSISHSGAAVFNAQSRNIDFRIAGENLPNLLYVDASNKNIGIGTNTPIHRLQVAGGSIVIDNNRSYTILSATGGALQVLAMDTSDNTILNSPGGDTRIQTRSSDAIRILEFSRFVGIGTITPGSRLAVSGAVVIGNNIGSEAAKAQLDVKGSISGALLTLSNMQNCILQASATGSVVCSTTAQLSGSSLKAASSTGVTFIIDSERSDTTGNVFEIYSDVSSDENKVFRIQANGVVHADGAYNSTGADYAEWFYAGNQQLKPGEVVCVDVTRSNAVKRCDRDADGNIMGIVSTNPAFIGNSIGGASGLMPPGYALVGLIGQVPAKVTNEGGEIRPGDALTSASAPGYARKAAAGESTVGVALEAMDAEEGVVNVLISRRNSSVTVEAVEEKVLQTIAGMEIEDEVQIMVSAALGDLNVDEQITTEVERQLADMQSQQQTIEAIMSELELLKEELARIRNMTGSTTVISQTGSFTRTSSLEVDGTLTTGDSARIGGDLHIDGALSASSLFVPNGLRIDGGVALNGLLDASELRVSSGAVIDGMLTVNGGMAFGSGSFLDLREAAVYISELIVDDSLFVMGDITIEGLAMFLKDVQIKGELILSDRHAGFAMIPRTGTSVTVRFGSGFSATPVVTASPDVPVLYAVSHTTATGFVLRLAGPAQEDVTFSWHALSVGNPVTIRAQVTDNGTMIFPLDSRNIPVSSNVVWNACIRNVPIFDDSGKPLSCGRYHDNYTWTHPDLGISFVWNTSMTPPYLKVPDSFVPTVTEDAASVEGAFNPEDDAEHIDEPDMIDQQEEEEPQASSSTGSSLSSAAPSSSASGSTTISSSAASSIVNQSASSEDASSSSSSSASTSSISSIAPISPSSSDSSESPASSASSIPSASPESSAPSISPDSPASSTPEPEPPEAEPASSAPTPEETNDEE